MNSWLKERLETLELERNQTRVIAVQNTKSKDVVQVLFAQYIDRPQRDEVAEEVEEYDPLAGFMEGHEAFVQGDRARLCWQSMTLKGVKSMLGEEVYAKAVKVEADDSGEKVYEKVDILNPTIINPRTKKENVLRVKLTETHKPENESEIKELAKTAKQDYKGNYLFTQETVVTPKGERVEGRKLAIFMHLSVKGYPEGTEIPHTFKQHTGKTELVEDLEWLSENEEEADVLSAYHAQKELTAPKDDQEAPKESAQEKEQV